MAERIPMTIVSTPMMMFTLLSAERPRVTRLMVGVGVIEEAKAGGEGERLVSKAEKGWLVERSLDLGVCLGFAYVPLVILDLRIDGGEL
jgi:hypothetical protein